MAVFNAAKREIDIKIVYYGPALCGKTTNVQCVHKMLAPHQRGEMMSLATKDDRTLFFDFLPIELGDVKGFKTRFHIYTVPGQVYYSLTRRAVLTGVDGVVFVADSQPSKMEENIESLNDLNENLKYYKKDLSSVPFIMQYNKRDLDDVMPVEELEAKLNTMKVPSFESSAVQGTGVVETLTTCCKLVLKQMDKGPGGKKRKSRTAPAPAPEQKAPEPPPQNAVPEADDVDEPIIKIISDEPDIAAAAEAEPEPVIEIPEPPPSEQALQVEPELELDAAPEMEIGVGGGDDPSMDALTLEEPAAVPAAEPDFSLETPAEPLGIDAPVEPAGMEDAGMPSLDLDNESAPAAEASDLTSDIPTFDMSGDAMEGFDIVGCGQPRKGPDKSLQIPIKFKTGQREGTVVLTIRFDDFSIK